MAPAQQPQSALTANGAVGLAGGDKGQPRVLMPAFGLQLLAAGGVHQRLALGGALDQAQQQAQQAALTRQGQRGGEVRLAPRHQAAQRCVPAPAGGGTKGAWQRS